MDYIIVAPSQLASNDYEWPFISAQSTFWNLLDKFIIYGSFSFIKTVHWFIFYSTQFNSCSAKKTRVNFLFLSYRA